MAQQRRRIAKYDGLREGVYFVQWRGHIKIGSANDVRLRLRGLITSIPEGDVVPLGYVYTPNTDGISKTETEARFHALLAPYRGRGEWFKDCPEVRAFIARHAQPWPTK